MKPSNNKLKKNSCNNQKYMLVKFVCVCSIMHKCYNLVHKTLVYDLMNKSISFCLDTTQQF